SLFPQEMRSYHSFFTPTLWLDKNLLLSNNVGKSGFYGFLFTRVSYACPEFIEGVDLSEI
ncbi:MAG TPA: hypothetical protein VFF49_04645, partial [Thermodesulfobacteriota bacterium]|nr:hypothetical protein [Thermodesulfobacteriota bacterium]